MPPTQGLPELHDFEDGMQTEVVTLLNTCFGGAWGNLDDWQWKHTHRPAFRGADIKLFISAGELVACFHSKVVPLTLVPGVTLTTSMQGDCAIWPNFRGLGLVDHAHVVLGERMLREGVDVRIGFTSPKLHERIYRKRFGHILVPTATQRYRKILSSVYLREKITELCDRLRQLPVVQSALRNGPWRVGLNIGGFERLFLELLPNSARCTATEGVPTDAVVNVPYGLLVAAWAGKGALLRKLFVGLLRGEIRSKGLLRRLRGDRSSKDHG